MKNIRSKRVEFKNYIWAFYGEYVSGQMNQKDIVKKCDDFARNIGYVFEEENMVYQAVTRELTKMIEKYKEYSKIYKKKIEMQLPTGEKLPNHIQLIERSDITIGMVKENPELWKEWYAQQKK